VLGCFDYWLVFADCTVRLNERCGFQQFAADVTLVASGFFGAAAGTLAFYEAVGEEALVMLTVEHLGFLLENVTVLLDFKKSFLDEFFVHWAFGAGVIVIGCSPSSE
jgi:hypothetical protein